MLANDMCLAVESLLCRMGMHALVVSNQLLIIVAAQFANREKRRVGPEHLEPAPPDSFHWLIYMVSSIVYMTRGSA